MKTFSIVLGAAALCAMLSAPAMAQGRACLLNQRVRSSEIVDQHTLVVTDRNHRRFTVHITGPECLNLDAAQMSLAFKTSMHEGCLTQGDRVIYSTPATGRTSCLVTGIKAMPARAHDSQG